MSVSAAGFASHPLILSVFVLASFALCLVVSGLSWRTSLILRQEAEAAQLNLGALVGAANDAILSRTTDGKIIGWNSAAGSLYGFAADEVLGSNYFPAFTREQGDAIDGLLSAIERGELVRHFNTKFASRGGAVIDVALTGVPVLGRGGKVVGMHILARDLAALTRVEEVQVSRAIEARLRAILDRSADALALLNAEGQILFCSAPALELLACPPRESWGCSIFEFVHEEDQGKLRAVLKSALAAPGAEMKIRSRIRHEGGSWLWVEAVFNNLLNVPAIESILLNFRDISDAVKAERAVLQSNNRFAQAFHANPLALSISTHDQGRYIDVNDAFLQMFGLTRERVIGSSSTALSLWVESEGRLILLQQLSESQRSKKPVETRMRAVDGEIRDVHIYAELIEMDGVACVLAITHDVTIAKQLEGQLMRSQRMEAVGRLAGGLAHDFNNVLGVIIGHSEIAQERLAPEHPIRRNIAQIRKAADRASTLIRQLLAFSRQQLLYPRVFDLNAVVANLNEMLTPMLGEDISIEFRPAPEMAAIRADTAQVEQVIMNLVINSRNAMPTGGRLIVEITHVELDSNYVASHMPVIPGQYVMLSVTDTGCGMSDEIIPHIFEPFFTTKEQGKGTGLGLSTVYGIVKQSKGFIWVYSEPGKGTTFKVYFPAILDTLPETLDLAREPVAVVQPATETILVVEDDELLRALVVRLLDDPGYRVLEAETAQAALELEERFPGKIDLLLTDVIMPKLSGGELAGLLRARRPDLKVLFMSGYSSELVEQHGATQPGIMVIQKPFSKNAFLAQVRAALQQKPSAETGT